MSNISSFYHRVGYELLLKHVDRDWIQHKLPKVRKDNKNYNLFNFTILGRYSHSTKGDTRSTRCWIELFAWSRWNPLARSKTT